MSDQRRDADFLDDIIEAMRRIVAYTDGMSYEQFLADDKTTDAVMRNFQVLGEAVKKLSPTVREAHSDLPWREMTGMRDRITHDYFGVNYDIVWAVARGQLPKLIPQIEELRDDS
jgi:uncharacterized protein with HEPN domain